MEYSLLINYGILLINYEILLINYRIFNFFYLLFINYEILLINNYGIFNLFIYYLLIIKYNRLTMEYLLIMK